ncbi:hypothetical protein D3C86_1644050 [compost metagenome]
MVDIDADHAQRAATALGQRQRGGQTRIEAAAIEQAGERVAAGQALELLIGILQLQRTLAYDLLHLLVDGQQAARHMVQRARQALHFARAVRLRHDGAGRAGLDMQGRA